MKKIILLAFGLLIFYSCLNNNDNSDSYGYEYLPIDEATTPANFTFGETDTITIKYSLPNGCYAFDRLYYEVKDTTRIVAVTALVNLSEDCTQAIIQDEFEFLVTANQEEDYVFKFFKGTDSAGENIFEEVVVPVN
ncbi:hypothetical protein [Polaribacter sp.]|uniref:hypothetical protein n=1 Tax=Polaribacter sp. TaxID=1920175 RepID=UPI003EF0B7CF